MRRFWPLFVLLIGGLFWWGLQRPNKDELKSVFVGKPAPTFSLPVLSPFQKQWGQAFGVGTSQGKPILLNIWASWCIPCREEAQLLEAYWQKNRDKVLFLGVNVQDKQTDALSFIKEFSLTFPSVFDERGRIALDYGYYGVPETFVINREGKVLARHAGALSPEAIERYLKQVEQ